MKRGVASEEGSGQGKGVWPRKSGVASERGVAS